jgi:hypothetical protein
MTRIKQALPFFLKKLIFYQLSRTLHEFVQSLEIIREERDGETLSSAMEQRNHAAATAE